MSRFAIFILSLLFMPAIAHAGYSHYFIWKIDPADPRLSQCAAEMKQLIEARRDILKVSTPDPQYQGNDQIHFNGVGENEYEDFVFPGNTLSRNVMFGTKVPAELIGSNFCKTAYKPYDEVVTSCLIVARDHFTEEELQIASDGSWDDWKVGRDLYERVLKRPAHSPIQDSGQVFAAFTPGGATAGSAAQPLSNLPVKSILQSEIKLGLILAVPIGLIVWLAVWLAGRKTS